MKLITYTMLTIIKTSNTILSLSGNVSIRSCLMSAMQLCTWQVSKGIHVSPWLSKGYFLTKKTVLRKQLDLHHSDSLVCSFILKYSYLYSLMFLKFVSAIFYQIFLFSPNDSSSKTMKNVFISSKKLFSFSRYSNFCNFFPSFPHFPDTKGQMEME